MIVINDDEVGLNAGLNKFRLKKHLKFKNAIKLAVAPHTLIPRKHLNIKNAMKLAVAPHALLMSRHGGGLNAGLNKFRLKKILKKVSLKNAVKATKFIAPMVAGMIPVGGGVASSLVGKLVQKVGKASAKVARLSETPIGQMVTNRIVEPRQTQVVSPQPTMTQIATSDFGAEPIGEVTSVKTLAPVRTAEPQSLTTEAEEPVGEVMPVKTKTMSREATAIASPISTEPKNNTMMYVGIGALALGGLYLATKKNK